MFTYLNIKINNIYNGRYFWGENCLYFVRPEYNRQVYAGCSLVWVRFQNGVKRLDIPQLGTYLHYWNLHFNNKMILRRTEILVEIHDRICWHSFIWKDFSGIPEICTSHAWKWEPWVQGRQLHLSYYRSPSPTVTNTGLSALQGSGCDSFPQGGVVVAPGLQCSFSVWSSKQIYSAVRLI